MTRFFTRSAALPAVVIAALGFSLLGGCGSGGDDGNDDPSPFPTATATPTPSGAVTATGRYQNIVFTLTTPKSAYAVGETVPLTLTLQNTGATDVTFAYSQPNLVGGDVTNAAGTYVSSLTAASRKASRQAAVYTIVVPAGQTQTYTLEWGNNSNNATPFQQTPPGSYDIAGYVFANTVDGASPSSVPGTDRLRIVVQ